MAWGTTFLVVGVGMGWVLWPVFSILFASAALAYLLDPVVDRFEAAGRSRELAIGIIFAVAALALSLLVLLFVPAVASQIQVLSGNVHGYLENLAAIVGPTAARIELQTGIHIPVDFVSLKQEVPGWLAQMSPDAREGLQGFLSHLFTSGFGFITAVLNLALLPIFTFYLLRDWDRLVARIHGLIPLSQRARVTRLALQVDMRLSAFVRGQITVCAVLAVLYSIGLTISGIDLAVGVGLLSGILFIVPYLGTVVGVVLASLLAIMKFGFDVHLIGVFLTFGIAQLIEGYLLTPKIVGDKVGLHPLVVMVALLVGGSLAGIWGMFLAIPLTAVLNVLGAEWLTIYQRSIAFRGQD